MTDPFVNPAATTARGLPVPRLTTQPAANPPIKLLPASDFPRVRTVTLLCCGWLGGVGCTCYMRRLETLYVVVGWVGWGLRVI